MKTEKNMAAGRLQALEGSVQGFLYGVSSRDP